MEKEKPQNKTILTIASDSTTSISGIIKLTKIEFLKLKHNVCNDHIWNNDKKKKDKDLWTLEDTDEVYAGKNKSKQKDRCHWLYKRDSKNGDQNKPDILPITIPKKVNLNFKITFDRVIDTTENITIKVKVGILGEECMLETEVFIQAGAKGVKEDFELEIEQAFDDILYTDKFHFVFSYSSGESNDIPIKNVPFEVYVTNGSPKLGSAWVTHNGRKYIKETYLHLTCKPCSRKGFTQEKDILEEFFRDFENKKLLRVREVKKNDRPINGLYLPVTYKGGLGYWRDESAASSHEYITTASTRRQRDYDDKSLKVPIMIEENRSVAFLLSYGVARCGEWTKFLGELLLVQGFNLSISSEVSICTNKYFSIVENIYDKARADQVKTQVFKYTKDYIAKYNAKYFTVKSAIFKDQPTVTEIEKESAGQGNLKAHPYFSDHVWFYHANSKSFYDPSYGIKMSKDDSNIITYIKNNITSIIDDKNQNRETDDIYKYIHADQNKF